MNLLPPYVIDSVKGLIFSIALFIFALVFGDCKPTPKAYTKELICFVYKDHYLSCKYLHTCIPRELMFVCCKYIISLILFI